MFYEKYEKPISLIISVIEDVVTASGTPDNPGGNIEDGSDFDD